MWQRGHNPHKCPRIARRSLFLLLFVAALVFTTKTRVICYLVSRKHISSEFIYFFVVLVFSFCVCVYLHTHSHLGVNVLKRPIVQRQ